MTYDEREHKARIVSDERKNGGSSKCTEPAVLDGIKARSGTILLSAADIAETIGHLTVDYRQLDTSRKSPEQYAQAALEWIKRK